MSDNAQNQTADCNCPEGRCVADEMNDIGQNSLSRCPRAKADAPVSNAPSKQTAPTAAMEYLQSQIGLKTSLLIRSEVEKLVGLAPGEPDSIYRDWWEDKPHQILARVLKGQWA